MKKNDKDVDAIVGRNLKHVNGGNMTGQRKGGVSAGNGSIVIGGNVQGSNIVMGNNNTISNQGANLGQLFESIFRAVDTDPKLKPADKDDIKAELNEVEVALKEPAPDENFVARHFRNIKRMAPELVEVAFETLKNPLGGVVEIIKRVAKKMAEDENTS